MSTFTTSVYKLADILPHQNADRLELAVVGGFRAVVQKDLHKAGDLVLYVQEDSILPQDVVDIFGYTDKLSGSKKNRVKAVRLRGELSQGLVVPVERLKAVLATRNLDTPIEEDTDYTALLGIEKYEIPIPAHFGGKARSWPTWIPRFDVENIKHPKFTHVFVEGDDVNITEKVHGANITCALSEDNEFIVCSHGVALLEDEKNTFWRAARAFQIEEKLRKVKDYMRKQTISVHAEVLGVQDIKYGFTNDKPGFVAFDFRIDGDWVSPNVFYSLCELAEIPHVPNLYTGPFSYELVQKLADEDSTYGGIREGVVIRPTRVSYDYVVGRRMLKFVGSRYLLRRGGNELH